MAEHNNTPSSDTPSEWDLSKEELAALSPDDKNRYFAWLALKTMADRYLQEHGLRTDAEEQTVNRLIDWAEGQNAHMFRVERKSSGNLLVVVTLYRRHFKYVITFELLPNGGVEHAIRAYTSYAVGELEESTKYIEGLLETEPDRRPRNNPMLRMSGTEQASVSVIARIDKPAKYYFFPYSLSDGQ